jgi:hypothetical protein
MNILPFTARAPPLSLSRRREALVLVVFVALERVRAIRQLVGDALVAERPQLGRRLLSLERLCRRDSARFDSPAEQVIASSMSKPRER